MKIFHWRQKLSLFLGLFSFFVVAIHTPTANAALELKAQFQTELDALREQYQFPGATAAYSLPDGTVEVIATGLADVEAEITMTPQSRTLAASIGKTFVGATVIALDREGQLALDAPVSKWLGERLWFSRLPNYRNITIRQLLTHSAGLPNHVYIEDFVQAYRESWQVPTNHFPPELAIAFILDLPPLFEPGTEWAYSDTGYLLMGLIIEAATGHSYYEEVTQRFLSPLNLSLTEPADRIELSGLAAGYVVPNNSFGLPTKTTDRSGVMLWNPGFEWTGGGLVSNPKDLVVCAKALFEGRTIAAPYLTDLLQSVPISAENPNVQYGIAVGIYTESPFGPTYGHDGWIPGYSSSLRY